ncbi:hypothetical protein HXX76_011126 [Chlamydomonas incerta]|uniref:Uncharacterized protein n=1 Tax=Chlamydomonas incerta TaxID=51695 RepID=A0A835SYZ1_CHLIN|nr:hypothetical protein HXX76_011126 [Chlamydomonas incerta]|eukprot:KAG2429360.1 hypothetical protein HXX76_011126 [Chlamydomonas incerta]
MTSSKPLVLVAGAQSVGKTSLVRAFSGSAAPVGSPDGTVQWHIDTKYYRTDVDVRECPDATIEASTSGQPEALVLAFSLKEPKTFATAQAVASRFDLEAVEVKLLIGTHADSLAPTSGSAAELETAEQPTWFQKAADWSIENGFELIICCPTVPAVDAALTLDGDRQGVARVVEALQAHMWPNLELLEKGKEAAAVGPTAASAAAGASSDGAGEETDAAAGSGYTALGGEDPAAAAVGSSSGRDAPPHAPQATSTIPAAAAVGHATCATANGGSKAAGGEAGKPAEAAMVGSETAAEGGAPEAGGPGDEEVEDQEAEKVMEGLEKLMEEMRGHKDRLGVMSDEERRERAAELAMRMMAMMGMEEDDEDTDDE